MRHTCCPGGIRCLEMQRNRTVGPQGKQLGQRPAVQSEAWAASGVDGNSDLGNSRMRVDG